MHRFSRASMITGWLVVPLTAAYMLYIAQNPLDDPGRAEAAFRTALVAGWVSWVILYSCRVVLEQLLVRQVAMARAAVLREPTVPLPVISDAVELPAPATVSAMRRLARKVTDA